MNITKATAETKSFTQGLYTMSDAKLLTGINYNVRNTSTSRSLLIVFDSNQQMQQLMRLEPYSPKYLLKPLVFGDLIVIIGGANLEFS